MKTLLLSFDLEDYHQLIHRSLGTEGWDRPGAAFERQMEAIFGLLDELGASATFFLLGVTMRHYPDIVREIGARGDEIACHGYDHELVHRQGREAFRRDVSRCVELIQGLTGRPPIGYRAPAFSIGRDTVWALECLAELGFVYDSSHYDTRKNPGRLRPVPDAPYLLQLPSGQTLWELPVAVWRVGRLTLPIGGGSYWRIAPAPLLRRALGSVHRRNPHPALYFHPYECDPQRLRLSMPRSASASQRARAAKLALLSNPGRRRLPVRIRRIAAHYSLASYEQALADIAADPRAGTRSLSERGVLV